jgi:ABC-type uncharacterized transport system permease subunit
MNTLVYADVPRTLTSSASSVASTLQQLSISFGVAAAGLVTVFFIPADARADASQMILGLHKAFIVLGLFTVLSSVVFSRMRTGDGASETQAKDIHIG